jgi:iron-sulfur cluster assembly accessory protein
MDDLDKFFAELETEIQNAETTKVIEKTTLDRKIIDDFHGNVPIFNDEVSGQLPTITSKAQIYISDVLEKGQYFRFAVDGGGCSGFNYAFDVETHPKKDDIQFSENPPSVIDSTSLKYLYGSIIDLDTSGMSKQLKVENPGAKASCGCGTSFAFDESMLLDAGIQ